MVADDQVSTGSGIAHPDRLYIAGDWTSPSSDLSPIRVIMPSTEELFVEVANAGVDDVNRAVAAARTAFDNGPWPRMSHGERASLMRAMADELRRRAPALGHVWTSEVGALTTRAGAIGGIAAGIFDYYAGLAESYPFEERHASPHGVGLLVREAVGVVAAIIPWNAPTMTIAYKVAPALLAGCTVVLKASPEAPGSALLLAEIAAAVGLPPGVLNVLTADRDVSEALVRNPDVDKVTFTGSTQAGKAIGAICASRVARCTLELGGKSAAIVLDDYPLDLAAKTLAHAERALCGQVCASLTRIIVPRHRHDALVEALAAEFGGSRVGDPFDPSTEMGPLASRRQRDRVESYIAIGLEEGARLATGGGRPVGLDRGFFVEPTVFANVDNNARVAREEIFGPVLSVVPADDEAHAVALANDSPFGLNASVFTHDSDRAYAVARDIRSGTVGHNGLKVDFGIAFGGFKQSGIGREGGLEGLLSFLEVKTVVLDAEPSHLAR